MRRLWSSSKHGPTVKPQLLARERSIKHTSDLWAEAYRDLARDNMKLVTALDQLLSVQQTQPTVDHSHAPPRQLPTLDDLSWTASSSKEVEISKFIEARLTAMNDRKWRVRLGEHSIEVREQIDRIIKIILVAQDFVSSVASMDPVHAGLPWAGVCLLLPILTNDSKQRSAAMDGVEYVAKLIRRYAEIERLYLDDRKLRLSEDLRTTMTKLYRIILEFEARTACQFSRNTAHQAIRNVIAADGWDEILASVKQHDTECEILIRIIDVEDFRVRNERLEDLLTNQDQRVTELLCESRKQDELFQLHIIAELQQGRNEFNERHLNEDESKCHECFRTNDYEFDKEKNPDRIPGTCEWFLQHPRYQKWLGATGSSWLWVTADPGCGKSVLSRFLIDIFNPWSRTPSSGNVNPLDSMPSGVTGEAQIQSKLSKTVCYFFFKDDSEVSRSSTNALTSILHQLFTQKHDLLKHALLSFKENGSDLAKLFESLWKIFHAVIADPVAGEIIVILDALDECAEKSREALVRKLTSLFSNARQGASLKLLITSRPSTPIGDQLWRGNIDPASIQLMGENEAEMEAISVEIELVIRERIKQFEQLRRHRGIEDNACEALLQRLLQVENRTYLWVSLIFPELERCAGLSEKKLLHAVQTIPTTIDDAYKSILSRSTDLEEARQLLKMVLGAERPLTLDEMNIALSTTNGCCFVEDLDLEPPKSFRTTVRDLCGLFVNIRDSRIYLIHQTAKEFLLAYWTDSPSDCLLTSSWKHSLHPAECANLMTRICTVYLRFTEFETCPFVPGGRRWSALQEATNEYLEKHALLEYASLYWYQYSRFLEYDEYERMLYVCDSESQAFQTWFQINWSAKNAGTCHPKGFNAWMVAAYFDLGEAFERLVHMGVEVDSLDFHGRSALWWALEMGNWHSAYTLIKWFTSPNSIDAVDVLQMASSREHADVVEILLESWHVEGTTRASDGWTAFQRAANNGHTRVLGALRMNSNSDAIRQATDMALYQAAANGQIDTVRYLLDKNISLEARSADGETPLYRSVANSDIAITELLLQHGANPNTLTDNAWSGEGRGETALYRAVCEKDLKIVLLLIEHRAEIDAKSWGCETALYRGVAAMTGGGDDANMIVELLLKSGADINLRTGMGDTPLRRTMRAGHITMKCILEAFAASSGIDIVANTADPSSQPSFLKNEMKAQQISKIHRSELFDTVEITEIFELDDGPNRDFYRSWVCQSFFGIASELDRVRDDM